MEKNELNFLVKHLIKLAMDEYYNPREEYIKKLEILASYDSDGREHEAARKWIEDYKEAESWNNMGGS